MKTSNRKKNIRRRFAWQKPKRPCPNCGEPGPHFAPPSLGEPGFFACKSKTL